MEGIEPLPGHPRGREAGEGPFGPGLALLEGLKFCLLKNGLFFNEINIYIYREFSIS